MAWWHIWFFGIQVTQKYGGRVNLGVVISSSTQPNLLPKLVLRTPDLKEACLCNILILCSTHPKHKHKCAQVLTSLH